MVKLSLASSIILGAVTLLTTGCDRERAVSFSTQVKPVLDANCLECHRQGGEGFEASGFSMETYEDVMIGTRYGPMVIAGDPLGSNILVLMEGRADPSISMPHGSDIRVPQADIDLIRAWIEQGAPNN
jgi:hypothetical protein